MGLGASFASVLPVAGHEVEGSCRVASWTESWAPGALTTRTETGYDAHTLAK